MTSAANKENHFFNTKNAKIRRYKNGYF